MLQSSGTVQTEPVNSVTDTDPELRRKLCRIRGHGRGRLGLSRAVGAGGGRTAARQGDK